MNVKPVPRILIGDDHRLMAEACAKMLQPALEVVEIVTDGRAFVKAALELKPDAGILDVAMPLLSGLDAVEQVKRKVPWMKMLFLTVNSEPCAVAEAFRRGASGYVLKRCAAEEFIGAIRRVLRGESYLAPQIARETMTYLQQERDHGSGEKQITRRQVEVLQLLAEGRAMKDIADILDITPGTVAFHKYAMMEKLGITSNAGLLLYAVKQHIVAA